jgi:redox-sensitive bicupin YhaK (pirin superfamily)
VSGPVLPPETETEDLFDDGVEVREGRVVELGGMGVARVLPTKGRRTIGAWCFVDLMSPADVEHPPRMEIGPHPHIGLSTVTWLFEGTALHGDSLGTEQLIRPGELNIMTAGAGIAHAELGVQTTGIGARAGDFSGAQLWIAQPEHTRHGASRFQHLDDVPRVEVDSASIDVFVGSIAGVSSAATVDTPLVGMDVTIRTAATLPLDPTFEYGIVPIDRPIRAAGTIVEPGSIAIIPAGGHAIPLMTSGGTARALVLGGVPLGERVQMWWNFVARTREEITEAWRAWKERNEDRFGPVPSELDRIEPPTPMWVKET